jgi:hypothetical protein
MGIIIFVGYLVYILILERKKNTVNSGNYVLPATPKGSTHLAQITNAFNCGHFIHAQGKGRLAHSAQMGQNKVAYRKSASMFARK